MLDAAGERGLTLPPLTASQALAGRGIRGEVAGRALALGNQRLFDELQLDSPLRQQATAWEAEGRTLSWLIEQGQPARVLGLLAFGDSLKAGAAAAVAALRDQGIESHLISGDNAGSANAVGRALGIDQVHAQVLPADKAAHVAALKRAGISVAMVGDGINDAPALAAADVGIAMGTGTDVAMNSAQVTLVKGDLRGISTARELSEATVGNMKQNLMFAFLYNALGIPIAAGLLYPFTGWLLSPMIAALAMSLSSASVVFNALRLQTPLIVQPRR